jgi:outer membrane murein-binding lipoprotein Lpp
MSKRNWLLAALTGTVAMLAAGQAGAQSTSVSSEEVRELHAEIQALQRKVQQLEAKTAGEKNGTCTPFRLCAGEGVGAASHRHRQDVPRKSAINLHTG